MTSDRGTSGVELQLNSPVTPKSAGLNPNANVFHSTKQTEGSTWEEPELLASPIVTQDGFQMNGDAGKYPCTVFPPTPDSSPMQTLSPVGDFDEANGATIQAAAEPCYAAIAAEAGVTLDESQTLDKQIPLDELKKLLQQQLEFYFSRENLASDTYLLSQMDDEQFVPIWTIANFNQVKKLTTDVPLIVEVLRQSPFVKVDVKGEKVKPNHKRCVVILREIPDATPIEAIKNLFNSEKCPKLVNCEFAHNNSWYVTFDSDEDAQKAYRYLREEVVVFAGKPIMARIKAKLARAAYVPKKGFKMMSATGGATSSMYEAVTTATATQAGANQAHTNVSSSAQSPVQVPQSQSQIFAQQANAYPAAPHQVNMPFNTQAFPFYPPNMLATTWHTNPPLFEPGMAFAANGFAPQATFKPAQSPNQGFQMGMNRNRNKSGHRSMSSSDHRGLDRTYDRGSYESRPLYDRYPSLGGGGSGGGGSGGGGGHGRIGGGGGQRSYSDSSYSSYRDKSEHSHSRYRRDAHSPNYPGHSQQTGSSLMKQDSEAQTTSSAFRQAHSEAKGDLLPQRTNRRRKKEPVASENGANTNGSNGSARPLRNGSSQTTISTNTTVLTATAKDTKPESPSFELESSSFPPLPGVTVTTTKTEEIFESRIADVVKGTAKPLTRDSKTQTVPMSPTNKGAATLANGEAQTHSPPASPAMLTKATNTSTKAVDTTEKTVKNPEEEVCAKVASSTLVKPATSPPPSRKPATAAAAVAAGKPASSIKSTSTDKPTSKGIQCQAPQQLQPQPTPVANGPVAVTVTGQASDDKSAPKLSYAQILARAKEKEKMAQEQKKEEEKKEALAVANKEKEKPKDKESISSSRLILKETPRSNRERDFRMRASRGQKENCRDERETRERRRDSAGLRSPTK